MEEPPSSTKKKNKWIKICYGLKAISECNNILNKEVKIDDSFIDCVVYAALSNTKFLNCYWKLYDITIENEKDPNRNLYIQTSKMAPVIGKYFLHWILMVNIL